MRAGSFTGGCVTIPTTVGSVTDGNSDDAVGGVGVVVAAKEANGAGVVGVIMLMMDGGIVAKPSELGGILP